MATSQGYFPKWQLPKSVLAPALGPQPVLAAVLGPVSHPSRSAQPPLQPAAPQRAKPNLKEFVAWEIAHLGSCHLGKCLW